MPGNRITLQIEPQGPDENDVQLTDFLYTLEAFRETLERTASDIAPGRPVNWKVVALSHSSPALVVVEPDVIGDEFGIETHAESIVSAFFSRAENLNYNGIAPPDMDRDDLAAFKRLAMPVKQDRIRVTIYNGARSVEIAGAVASLVDRVLEPKTRTWGSATGRLEYMDIHAKTRVFRIYPAVGRQWIRCVFPARLLNDAKNALGSNVRVYGEVTYLERDNFPAAVRVTEIESLGDESTLPTLQDIFGMAPGSPDDPPAEDLIRAIRTD